jgi:hypothetical protein
MVEFLIVVAGEAKLGIDLLSAHPVIKTNGDRRDTQQIVAWPLHPIQNGSLTIGKAIQIVIAQESLAQNDINGITIVSVDGGVCERRHHRKKHDRRGNTPHADLPVKMQIAYAHDFPLLSVVPGVTLKMLIESKCAMLRRT